MSCEHWSQTHRQLWPGSACALLSCALHGFWGTTKSQNCPSPDSDGLHMGQDRAHQTTHCCTCPGMSDIGCHLQLWDMSTELTHCRQVTGITAPHFARAIDGLVVRDIALSFPVKRDTAQLPLDSPSLQRACPTSCTCSAASKHCILSEDTCSLQS